MRPIDPAELSALLDGELSVERAGQVRRAIAEDETLRREYEEIAALDVEFKAYAEAAAFRPRVSMAATTAPRISLLPLVVGLLLLRVLLKSTPFLVATGLEVVVLAFLVGWVLQRLVVAAEQERRAAQLEVLTAP